MELALFLSLFSLRMPPVQVQYQKIAQQTRTDVAPGGVVDSNSFFGCLSDSTYVIPGWMNIKSNLPTYIDGLTGLTQITQGLISAMNFAPELNRDSS